MSIKWLNSAWGIRNVTPTQKLILLALSDRADESGKCWPGVPNIAKRTCLTTRCVIKNIAILEGQGFIKKERRGGDGEGAKSNIYTLKFGQCERGSHRGNVNEVQGLSEQRSGGQSERDDGQSERGSPEPLDNRQIKTLLPDSDESSAPENFNNRFEDWWNAYGKKTGKKKTRNKWERLNWKKLGVTPDDLIADAQRRHVGHRRWLEGYQPDPLTYLNGELWNDAIEAPKVAKVTLPRDAQDLRRLLSRMDLDPFLDPDEAKKAISAHLMANPGARELLT